MLIGLEVFFSTGMIDHRQSRCTLQVPSFETEEEAMEFMLKWSRVGSNLDQRNYMHIFTLLTSWDQVGVMIFTELDIHFHK